MLTPAPAPGVLEYLERIDSTLEPYSGRFLIHGGAKEVLEGAWPGAIVVIEFPRMAEAKVLVHLTRLPGDP